MNGYVLTAPKPKLQRSASGTSPTFFGSTLNQSQLMRIKSRGRTMQALVDLLLPVVQSRVVNETNLEGRFDFEIEFIPPVTTTPMDGPSIFAALSDLGLSLKTGKRKVSVFVIDNADRMPIPN